MGMWKMCERVVEDDVHKKRTSGLRLECRKSAIMKQKKRTILWVIPIDTGQKKRREVAWDLHQGTKVHASEAGCQHCDCEHHSWLKACQQATSDE